MNGKTRPGAFHAPALPDYFAPAQLRYAPSAEWIASWSAAVARTRENKAALAETLSRCAHDGRRWTEDDQPAVAFALSSARSRSEVERLPAAPLGLWLFSVRAVRERPPHDLIDACVADFYGARGLVGLSVFADIMGANSRSVLVFSPRINRHRMIMELNPLQTKPLKWAILAGQGAH